MAEKAVDDGVPVSSEMEHLSSFSNPFAFMTKAERRKKRSKRKSKTQDKTVKANPNGISSVDDLRTSNLLAKNEDELIKFVAKINKVYQEKLKKPAPFMTFVFCGMQSAGKSTIMERFMNAVLNIVQQGTGTRCPLDTTCIHDEALTHPVCELRGEELDEKKAGDNLNVSDVFKMITEVNKRLGDEDRFSTKPLYLTYRAQNVQNMRFVDTPGIISNQSATGKDNREDIKTILRSEMKKPNSKLCVLLEPKEFDTNPIIDFCDSSFGKRDKWIHNATFLMTKFDKQANDCKTCSKANCFFKTFHENKCFPHLVITPTLPKENLPPLKLFKARKELLQSADKYEEAEFKDWNDVLDAFFAENQDELLLPEVKEKIGFLSAKQVMREIMLDDTAKRLPEVLAALRTELSQNTKELKTLQEQQKFCDPKELRLVVGTMLIEINGRIKSYLEGDLKSSIKFPERLQTLDEEIDNEEDDEDWSSRELNFYSEKEDVWRERIAHMEEYPEEIQANERFLGGKQYQRAIEFFRAVLLEALPNPELLKDKIPNVTGYLSDGLHRENWEHAMVEIIRVSMKDASHPGINYLIKHVGSIFRRLFLLSLDDIKEGEKLSATFKLLPSKVEKFLITQFESMLWELMEEASKQIHSSLEPMYSTIDPTLPTFRDYTNESDEETFVLRDGKYEPIRSAEKTKEEWTSWALKRLESLRLSSGVQAKAFLKKESQQRALARKAFLPDKRTSMIRSDEVDTILQRSFEYIVALMEFNLTNLKFQLNHYLFQGFKDKLGQFFMVSTTNANWDSLVQKDPAVQNRIENLKEQISSIDDSLKDVEAMQRRM